MVIQIAVVAARTLAKPMTKLVQSFSKASKQISKTTKKIKDIKKNYGEFSKSQDKFKGKIDKLKNTFKRLSKVMKGVSFIYNIMTKFFKFALGLLTMCFGAPQLQGALARIKLEAELIAWKIGNSLAPIFESLSNILHSIRVGDWVGFKKGMSSLIGNISDLLGNTILFVKDKIINNGIMDFFKNNLYKVGETIGNKLLEMFPSLSSNYVFLVITNRIKRKAWHLLLAPFIPMYLIYWFIKTRDIKFENLVDPIIEYIEEKKEFISTTITTGIDNLLIGNKFGEKLWSIGKDKIFDYLIPHVLNKMPIFRFFRKEVKILLNLLKKGNKLFEPGNNNLDIMANFYNALSIAMPGNYLVDFAKNAHESEKLFNLVPEIYDTTNLFNTTLDDINNNVLTKFKQSHINSLDTIYSFAVSGQTVDQPNIYLTNIEGESNMIRVTINSPINSTSITLGDSNGRAAYNNFDNKQYLMNDKIGYKNIQFGNNIVTISRPYVFPDEQPQVIKIKVTESEKYSDLIGNSYQVGGMVPYTGLHYVHAGERIVPLGATDNEEMKNVLTIDITDDIIVQNDNDINRIVDQYVNF